MAKRIMVVDDSVSIVTAVDSILAAAGYEVVKAYDGEDALNKLRENPVKMIISDLNMPNIDGFEFTRRAREYPYCKFIPIFMLTTESEVSKKLKGLNAGISGWIVKPFTPDDILKPAKRFVR